MSELCYKCKKNGIKCTQCNNYACQGKHMRLMNKTNQNWCLECIDKRLFSPYKPDKPKHCFNWYRGAYVTSEKEYTLSEEDEAKCKKNILDKIGGIRDEITKEKDNANAWCGSKEVLGDITADDIHVTLPNMFFIEGSYFCIMDLNFIMPLHRAHSDMSFESGVLKVYEYDRTMIVDDNKKEIRVYIREGKEHFDESNNHKTLTVVETGHVIKDLIRAYNWLLP